MKTKHEKYSFLFVIVSAFVVGACYNYNGMENVAVHSVETKKALSE